MMDGGYLVMDLQLYHDLLKIIREKYVNQSRQIGRSNGYFPMK